MKTFNSLLKHGIGAVAISCCVSLAANAQEATSEYNPNSVRPIAESDQLYATRVWRRIDLREKQNKPFFSENRQITKTIIDAVMNGTLYPYTSDSLTTRMSKEQFIEKLSIPTDEVGPTEDEIAMGFGQEQKQDDGWGDAWGDSSSSGQGAEGTKVKGESTPAANANEPLLFGPRDVTVLELMEDVIFDKERGRQYYDIQAVTMILPPENFPETGLLRPVASFKYKDLIRVFHENPETAVWVNPYNNAKHLNLEYAFDLRLFSGRVVKYSNPDDEYIIDMEDGNRRQALLKSLDYEYDMLEREHQLWEY